MNDTNKAADEVADVAVKNGEETETSQTNSPQVEKPITGAETTQENSDQSSVAGESDVESTMTEEQRRAFQEMRLENKRLKEERESGTESAFKPFRPNAQTANVPPLKVEDYTDTLTGEVNWKAYNEASRVHDQQVLQQARSEAAKATEELLDERDARAKYPELFRDAHTEKLIAGRWLLEKMNGRDVSVSAIAEEFARNFRQATSKAEKAGAEKILNEVTEKEKAGLVVDSQTSQPTRSSQSQEEAERLSVKTRGGDFDAIAARISQIPWANK